MQSIYCDLGGSIADCVVVSPCDQVRAVQRSQEVDDAPMDADDFKALNLQTSTFRLSELVESCRRV